MILDSEQLANFEREGLLFIESVFSEPEVDTLTAALHEVCEAAPPQSVRETDGQTIRMVHGAHRDHEVFRRLSRHPRLVQPSEQLLASRVYVYQSRINLKAPIGSHIAQGYPWHQDFSTWHRRDGLPEPAAVVAFAFLDDITASNAPLLVIPGSHHAGLAGYTPGEPGSDGAYRQTVIPPDLLGRLADEGGIAAQVGPRGSVLFMHCNLVHGSTENISPLRRAIYSIVYSKIGNDPQGSTAASSYLPESCSAVEALPDDCLLAR